ncbi:NADPH-flavin oxidoreductase [Streptantibioticus cattleyicolor NRRL 8057 = DSM 46488]|nr:NADPH-flavin oxidoreductase [Streptantibioticus cattleyicolor NRRL 8057 = DSM 46488]
MAVAAVRYLRSVGAATSAGPAGGSPARPVLRAVGAPEGSPERMDPAEFRRVLGHFATGVTVVTAPAAAGEERPAGFACQSFASLSLDPPLVAFMVSRTSTTWPRIANAGVFCVNILGAGQDAQCRAFAVSGADKFAGVEWSPAPATGSPLLAGVAAWVDCTVHTVHTGGDHLVVIGRVDDLGTADEPVAPLLFHRGRFGRFTAVDG